MHKNEHTYNGKEWCTLVIVFIFMSFDISLRPLSLSHLKHLSGMYQVRMNPGNDILCMQLVHCMDIVQEVHTCSSSLCEWSLQYCEPRIHIYSTFLNHGDTSSSGIIPIRFILTDATSDFTFDDVAVVGGNLLNFQQTRPLIPYLLH